MNAYLYEVKYAKDAAKTLPKIVAVVADNQAEADDAIATWSADPVNKVVKAKEKKPPVLIVAEA